MSCIVSVETINTLYVSSVFMKARSTIGSRRAVPERATAAAAQRIVTAARQHFFTHGFRGVTMDDLAEELGMSKKTLYAEFAGKTALLRAVLLDKFHSVKRTSTRL